MRDAERRGESWSEPSGGSGMERGVSPWQLGRGWGPADVGLQTGPVLADRRTGEGPAGPGVGLPVN